MADSPVLRPHGGVRGGETPIGSQLFQGTFGRMFRTLPAAEFSDGALTALGNAMTAAAEPANTVTPETQPDNEENTGIAAGYTYLGQFIDHDITFDPMSSLMRQNDPDALVDFRTPRFDLDSVYGRGPDDQPYLYDGIRMQLGAPLTGNGDPNARDLPRHTSTKGGLARALIGDPRNDENQIVSQLQALFLRFHNVLVDENSGAGFAEVQRLVRWHYQFVVLHDFLPTIVGEDTVFDVLPHLKSGKTIFDDPPKLHFYKWRNDPFMPVEFSVAAYRFGHSMIRPQYRVNTTLKTADPPPANDPMNGRKMIFDPASIFDPVNDKSLSGFRALPPDAAIDFNLYFHVRDHAPDFGIGRVQPAYKIDTSLVNPLGFLPDRIAGPIHSLPVRNLLRGSKFGLPTGQDVARAMGLEPLSDDELKVGKATQADTPDNKGIVAAVGGDLGKEFIGKAPLWFYVLSEAQQQFKNDKTPIRLGEVGGRIVTETFVGLLLGDGYSFLTQDPGWHPPGSKKFGMRDIVRKVLAKGGV
jgi:hypothetical protein